MEINPVLQLLVETIERSAMQFFELCGLQICDIQINVMHFICICGKFCMSANNNRHFNVISTLYEELRTLEDTTTITAITARSSSIGINKVTITVLIEYCDYSASRII